MKATFAAGCFWGVEAEFQKVNGVKSSMVGYTWGDFKNPTYHDVCSGKTGHAEAIQIEYDSDLVSYEQLLKIFWNIHDPTTLNRQGPDVGSQYRSAIFFHSPDQEKFAIKSKEILQNSDKHPNKVVTEIIPVSSFYKAEEYHQKYFEKGKLGSCGIAMSNQETQS